MGCHPLAWACTCGHGLRYDHGGSTGSTAPARRLRGRDCAVFGARGCTLGWKIKLLKGRKSVILGAAQIPKMTDFQSLKNSRIVLPSQSAATTVPCLEHVLWQCPAHDGARSVLALASALARRLGWHAGTAEEEKQVLARRLEQTGHVREEEACGRLRRGCPLLGGEVVGGARRRLILSNTRFRLCR